MSDMVQDQLWPDGTFTPCSIIRCAGIGRKGSFTGSAPSAIVSTGAAGTEVTAHD